ncbi:hypothetical protein Hanom_Chr08g00719261 [Helianthus anomalus]
MFTLYIIPYITLQLFCASSLVHYVFGVCQKKVYIFTFIPKVLTFYNFNTT